MSSNLSHHSQEENMSNPEDTKSPLGQRLFNMCVDMTNAQAKVYQAGGSEDEAAQAARIMAALHRPLVLDPIKRVSQRQPHPKLEEFK